MSDDVYATEQQLTEFYNSTANDLCIKDINAVLVEVAFRCYFESWHNPSVRQLVLTAQPLNSSGQPCVRCRDKTAFTCVCGQPMCLACADGHVPCKCDKVARTGKRRRIS